MSTCSNCGAVIDGIQVMLGQLSYNAKGEVLRICEECDVEDLNEIEYRTKSKIKRFPKHL